MLRKALMALSNVVNELPVYCCDLLCYFRVIFCYFILSGLIQFQLQADEVCRLAHVLALVQPEPGPERAGAGDPGAQPGAAVHVGRLTQFVTRSCGQPCVSGRHNSWIY